MFFNLVFILLIPRTVTCFLNWGYTEEAFTVDGDPCMTDCVKRKCVVNWKQHVKSCTPTGKPSPIYFTSQKKDRSNNRCLSNCGYFGYSYEWCITTQLKRWDYCSSNVRGDIYTLGVYPKAKTTRGVLCTSDWRGYNYCLKNQNTPYYWCNTNGKGKWDYCAPAASTRIPTLSTDFRIGSYVSRDECPINSNSDNLDSYTSTVPDDYLENTVKVLQEEFTTLVKVISDPNNTVTKYKLTTVDMPKRSSVPVAIQIKIDKDTLKSKKFLLLREIILKHLKEMRAPENSPIEPGNLELGTDFKKECRVFVSLHWLAVELYVSLFGETVETDVLIVIFYENYENPVPQAIGVSAKKTYSDGKKEYCYEKVFFNGRPDSRYVV